MRLLIAALAVVWALPLAAQTEATPEPAAQVEAIVAQLRAGKTAGVLERAFAGSLASKQKGEQIRAMDGQAKAALDYIGPVRDSEIVEFKKLGSSLVRIKWITKHTDDNPLFWNSLFFKKSGRWELLSLVFFDDPMKAGLLQ